MRRRRFRRRFRKIFRRRFRNFKSRVRKVVSKLSECKFAYAQFVGNADASGGSISFALLPGISQGTGRTSRVGNQIKGERYTMDARFSVTNATPILATTGETVVYIVLLRMSVTQFTTFLATMNPDTVMDTTDFWVLRKWRFKMGTFPTATVGGTANLNGIWASKHIRWSRRFPAQIKYYGNADTVPTDIRAVPYIIVSSTIPTAQGTVSCVINSKYSFRDL